MSQRLFDMNQMIDVHSPNITKKLILIGYALFSSSLLLDLSVDVFELQESMNMLLKAIEVMIFVIGTGGFIYLWRLLGQTDQHLRTIHELNRTVNQHVEANEVMRQEFKEYVTAQFEKWSFTESEKDVAFFMLKGLSFKEIADIRGVSERTIRNQSISIYSKSKLSGKHELAVYFLEEMFSR
jgi:DNA-binding CsgD family transcriptional regulator